MFLLIAIMVVNVALAGLCLYYARWAHRERKQIEAREANRAYVAEHGAWSDEALNADWWNEPPREGEA